MISFNGEVKDFELVNDWRNIRFDGQIDQDGLDMDEIVGCIGYSLELSDTQLNELITNIGLDRIIDLCKAEIKEYLKDE